MSNKKKSLSVKDNKNNDWINKQARKATIHRILLIVFGIVAIVICVVLYAHHNVVQTHHQANQQTHQTVEIQKRNREQARDAAKNRRVQARRLNQQYLKHPNARQRKLKTLIASMNRGFSQRKANVRAFYSPSTGLLDYELIGPLAKSWSAPVEMQQEKPKKNRKSIKAYNKKLSQLTIKQDRIQQTISKLHKKVQSAVKDPQLQFKITPVKRFISLTR